MLYELRTYETLPGRMPALSKRFAEVTMDLFKRHGLEVVGFWTNEVGGYNNELIYLMRYEDMGDRERKWAAFGADKDWQRARVASEEDGPILWRIKAHFLRPTAYSPLQ